MEKLAEEERKRKPHCLILPFPIQGHINPMLQFSKRLSHKGIAITLATTNNLLTTTQDLSSPISVETISDGGPVEPLQAYLDRFQRAGSETLSELLEKLKDSGRPVDCVIYDPFLPWGLSVARKFGLVGAAFFTQSSSVNIIYYNVHKGQLKVPLSDKEVIFDFLGLPTTLGISDLPSFLCDQESHPGSFELALNQFQNIEEADYVFVNSVYELEEEVIYVCLLLYIRFFFFTLSSTFWVKIRVKFFNFCQFLYEVF